MLIDKDCGIHLEIVDSTNTYCKKKEVPTGYFVLAKEQTAGRGRNSRKWISQGEEKFFFSAKFSLPNIHFSIPLLSLFIGSAVLKTLLKHFPDLQTDLKLKWPNDIYLKNKKVSGVLIESEYIDSTSIFIAGIGINLFGKEKIVESEYLSETALGKEFKTNLIYTLIEFINEIEFILSNSESTQKELNWIYENSYLRNKKVESIQNGEKFSGNVVGYDRNGFLIVKKEDENLVIVLDTSPDFKVI
ncbi:MAG: biotin--[acetyl-CoA-carboxylase] ligase [Leptospiraceae bacterium]|nr:biotin--[acetyl-CoA-carboxylase] ligase [Leptospiraceae bacterium]